MLARCAALTVARRLQASAAAGATWASFGGHAAPATSTSPAATAIPAPPPPRHTDPHHAPALLLPPSLFDALASIFPPSRRSAARVVDLTPGGAATQQPMAVPLAARGLRASAADAAAPGSADLVVACVGQEDQDQRQLLQQARRLVRPDGGGYLGLARLELDESSPFSRSLLALLRAHGAGGRSGGEASSSSSLACAAADAVASCAAADGGPAPAVATLSPSASAPSAAPSAAAAAASSFGASAANHSFEPRSHSSHACPVELRGGPSALAHALATHPSMAALWGGDELAPADRRALAADLRELANDHGAATLVGGGALRVDLRARLAVMQRAADAALERRRRYDDF